MSLDISLCPLEKKNKDDARFSKSVRWLCRINQSGSSSPRLLFRSWGDIVASYTVNELHEVSSYKGPHFYAGVLLPQFGHFLLESLARLSRNKSNKPIVFHVPPNSLIKKYACLPVWQKKIFESLGYNENNVFIIKDNCRFNDLEISEPGFVIKEYLSIDHAHFLKYIGDNVVRSSPFYGVVGQYEKVWLSRSKLDTGRVLDEEHFEKYLKSMGFFIFHPQEYSIDEQINILSNARLIAGFCGSAFHALVLCDCKDKTVIHFNRFKSENLNYKIIADRIMPKALFFNYYLHGLNDYGSKSDCTVSLETISFKLIELGHALTPYYKNM